MPDKEQSTALVKVNTGLQRVSRQIATTNKLLTEINPILIPYRKKDKWGFCTPDKKIVIDFVYDRTYPFYDESAAVKKEGRDYFINREGKTIAEFHYIYEYDWHYNDTVPQSYWLRITANITNTEIRKLHKKIMRQIPYPYYYDTDESLKIPAKYEEGGKFGLMKIDGAKLTGDGYQSWTKLTVPDYQSIEDFDDEMATVKLEGKYGFVNLEGTLIIPCQYDLALNFREGFAKVLLKDKFFFINKKGERVTGLFDDIECDNEYWNEWDKNINSATNYFHEGFVAVRINTYNEKEGWYDRSYYYINNLGQIAFDQKFREVTRFGCGVAGVRIIDKDRTNIINTIGTVIDEKYDPVDLISDDFSLAFNLIKVRLKGKFGMIDFKGNELAPCIYDLIEPFQDGIAKVKISNGYGFIDERGNTVLQCKYAEAYTCGNGFVRVMKNGDWKCYNIRNKLLFDFEDAEDFNEGLAIIKKNNKYGFIDQNGKIIIDCIYQYANHFSDGVAKVRFNDEFFFINKQGKRLFGEREYSLNGYSINPGTPNFSSGLLLIKGDKTFGYIDKRGIEYWED